MRVVDTSAWIEWLIGSALGQRLRTEIPAREACLVPTLVQLELAKWLARETDADRTDEVLAYTAKCIVVPLDTRIALLAAECCRTFRLATADAIVYATARNAGCDVLTCDAHFAGLPGAAYVPKSGRSG